MKDKEGMKDGVNISDGQYGHLLSHTQSLMDMIVYIQQDFGLLPQKDHYGLSIAYTDFLERRDDFILQLISTIVSWVYSKSHQERLYSDLMLQTFDTGQSSSKLFLSAKRKFRVGHPQGQFGELLLFNLIQHFFQAPPIVRKMCITTNPSLERNGADAIHYRKNGTSSIFYIGESKCYSSNYSFKQAFKSSLNSIISSVENIFNELNLYHEVDFLETEMKQVANDLINNKIKDPRFELVCIITYSENCFGEDCCADNLKEKIKSIIKSQSNKITQDIYPNNHNHLLRITYIIFPINSLDELLKAYSKELGI